MRAFEWLRENTDEDARVMTPPLVGNFAGRYADRRVYVGHGQHTIDFERKAGTAARFFDPTTPEQERRRILGESGCEYIAVDARHRAALAAWSDLQELFASPQMTIYRLRNVSGRSRA